ncbi:AMP-binding protein [Epidermidibacterium keratini]|uniref:AMP-binding protein n=1 Tax=Epidermidibacterium keratini TaxID=1891644 RepID=A0A7L4YJH9_9ACTN|nr:AMP-binding protein [Epidermidibacterium keratini]QHB99251.1 AMP-binding protein [Epidermidibacterium keratini]
MTRQPFLHRVDSYDALWSQVNWREFPIPREFNLGSACIDEQDPTARAITIVERDRTSTDYTFGDIVERANRLANVLADKGIKRGDIVAIINPQSLQTAVSFMAIFRMGAIALPISHLFGPDALQYRFENSGARAVIVNQRRADSVREALGADSDVAVIVIDDGPDGFDALLAGASSDFEPVVTAAEDPALLIYTSGTTGNPKGALHAHRIVFGQIPIFEAAYDFYPEPGDVLWSVADWAWIAGIMDILVPAWFYGLPVIVDMDDRFDPERVVWLMREHGVTLSLLPATALRGLRASGVEGGGFAFRALVSGGEPLGAELTDWAREFFGCDVNDAYGQTEMNGLCAGSARVYPAREGAIGRPGPGNIVAVLDDAGNSLVGQSGEIAVDRHHPIVMLEYWKNPEATEGKFLGDWLLTGDVGTMDEDGYLWFESRKDDVITSSGYRVGPPEIEHTLGAHPAVAMAAVIGVPDEKRGEAPKAFVVLRDPQAASDDLAAELKTYVRDRLAAHEVPRDVVFVDDLPRTVTGKIMRRALRDD